MKLFLKNSMFLVLGIILLSSSAFAAKNACYSTAELNDFKTIYIKLQQQLNYEGSDAYLDKKFQVQLRPHAKDTPYGGKEFELAMFGEYQNSLRKVARIYQAAKFEKDDSFKSNPLLVKFMEAIEDKKSDSSAFIQQTKIKEVIQALEDASIKKFGNTTDKKFVLNSGDKYLLEKLLTHAQDRICNLITFDKTGKDTFLFKKDYLQKVKNAPLNRLVNSLKNASLTKDSKIDLSDSSPLTGSLIDTSAAVQSAVAENINQLSEWVKKVKARGDKCLDALKTKSFGNSIQANIQSCNLGHFIDTLSADNVSNLESILHYINANERLLNFAQAKAETGLDELELENMIDKTFAKVGQKISCTIVEAENGKKKIFVRNIPFSNNKYDTSKVTCKINSKELKANECAQKIEFISDEFGRGVELRQKAKTGPAITISITENPNCDDMNLENNDEPVVEKPMLDFKMDEPKIEGLKDLPALDIVSGEAAKDDLMTADKCKAEGEKLDPKKLLVLSEDKKSCVEPKDDKEQKCIEANKKWIEEKNDGRPGLKWDWDGKQCVDKKPDKDTAKKASEAPVEDEAPIPLKQPPGRFTPIGIPGRGMSVLPGAW